VKGLILPVVFAACLLGQTQPRVENAKLEVRDFAGSLAAQITQAGPGPLWMAWAEPAQAGRGGDSCLSEVSHLEGQTSFVVLVRIENSRADQIRISSPDCRFDAGGLAFLWLNNVPASESVTWLKSQFAGPHADAALRAIGLHSGPEALAALFEAAKNDRNPRIRSRAFFWLAQKAGNKQAQKAIGDVLANDPDRSVREQAVFALKQLPPDQGIPLLIGVAKNNADTAVRKKAMFWLGQSTDPRALEFFAQVLKP